MTAEDEHRRERSVDSLQQIYAVIIALAIAQAIESLLKDPASGAMLASYQILTGLPPLVAFLATLIPFWHGMNRHLDRCYLEKKGAVKQFGLLWDFTAFFVEGCLLFAAGWSLRSGIRSFEFLGALLVVDMGWGSVAHLIHFRGQKSHIAKWSRVNVVAIAVAIPIIVLHIPSKPWVLMALAILRSIADYRFCRDFYFPRS
jgi:hypothetical protein